MENAFLRWWGCGAFDVMLGDVNFAFDPYLFDQNLERIEPCYDYIFIKINSSYSLICLRNTNSICFGKK